MHKKFLRLPTGKSRENRKVNMFFASGAFRRATPNTVASIAAFSFSLRCAMLCYAIYISYNVFSHLRPFRYVHATSQHWNQTLGGCSCMARYTPLTFTHACLKRAQHRPACVLPFDLFVACLFASRTLFLLCTSRPVYRLFNFSIIPSSRHEKSNSAV